MSDTFGELFAQYQVKMGIKNSKDLCAEISRILETFPEAKQLEMIKGFVDDDGHTLRKLMIILAHNQADITVLAKQIEVFNELPVTAPASIDPSTQVPAANPDPKASLPKAKPETAAPNSNGIVPPSAPVVFKPQAPSTTSNSQPNVEENPADEDGGGDDGEEDVVTPAPKPQAPRVVRTPNAPVFVQQHVDPPSFGDWFKHPIESFQKMQESKAGQRANSNHGGLNKSSNRNPKPKQGRSVFSIIGLFFVVLVLIFATVYTATKLGDNGVAPEFPQGNPSGVSPDSDPETVLEGFEMNTVIDSTEPLLKKPTIQSFVDGTVWSDFPLSWAIWFLVLFAPLLMLVQDRFAEHEETDLRMVIPGLIILMAMVFGSYPLSALLQFQGVDPASLEVFKKFFEKFLVIVGVLVNIAFQWSATMSGKKDYSALAFAGLFLSGAIVYWWYPDNTVVAVIGWALMLGGIALQYVEIGVSGQGTRAVIVSLIMIAAFFFGFSIGVGIITDWSVALYDISPVMALILYQWRVFIAVIVISTPIAIGIGFLAGMFLLRIERSDGGATEDSVASIARLGEVVLYDAISFGIMLMYPLVSVMWFMSAVSVALN